MSYEPQETLITIDLSSVEFSVADQLLEDDDGHLVLTWRDTMTGRGHFAFLSPEEARSFAGALNHYAGRAINRRIRAELG